MATYTHLEAANSPAATWADLDAIYFGASSTLVVLTNTDGTLTNLVGSGFTFTGSGSGIVLTGGTITELGRTNAAGTTLYEQITALSYAATAFQSHISDPNLGGLMHDVLGGDDTLIGFSGGEVLIGGPGADVLDGKGGSNVASYQNATSGVVADLSDPTQNKGDAAGDTYIHIQSLFGSPFNDTLIGDAGGNFLRGGLGADHLDGGTVPAGQGGDFADYRGSAAGLTVNLADPSQNTGEAAGDTYTNIGSIRGSFFNDILIGDANNNTLRGGVGADVLNGGAGTDDASYADSATGLTASLADPSQNTGEAAGDTYISIENLAGSSFDDKLIGDAGNNVLQGHGGADTLVGGAGSDTASYSSAGTSLLVDLADPSRNTGEAAGDTYSSIENLRGGEFDDSLFGDNGTNILNGAGGNDLLSGRGGNDILNGGADDDTAVFSGMFNEATIKNFGAKIVVVGPDGTDTLLSIEHLKFADVTITPADYTSSVIPEFDPLYYLSRNADVFQAHIDPLAHYNAFGWHEGRDPNAFFDTSAYLAANKDAAAAAMNPLDHYDQVGWQKGLNPGPSFDTRLYLLHNPDVMASGIDPLAHYLTFGAAEGRQAYQAVGTATNGFDAEYYLFYNSDVAAAGVDPLAHYNAIGWKEGRNPNRWFDTAGYLSHYQDVAAAGVNPLQHYEQSDWKEGRDPSASFDTLGYLMANRDVEAAGISPLDHFINYGIYEGRGAVNDGTWH